MRLQCRRALSRVRLCEGGVLGDEAKPLSERLCLPIQYHVGPWVMLSVGLV